MLTIPGSFPELKCEGLAIQKRDTAMQWQVHVWQGHLSMPTPTALCLKE